MRLDMYLVKLLYVKSRSFAERAISNGYVEVDGQTIKKPSFRMDEKRKYDIKISAPEAAYVSRGGLKLEAALSEFNIKAEGAVCVDIGSSTGGFTDCLLKHGASKVYAIDSGKNQLAPVLNNDKRVVCIEKFNARYLSFQTIESYCDIVTADLSFISQTYIIPNALSVLKYNGVYIGLIKPQFECGKEGVGKNGIVKNEKLRQFAVERVINSAEESGLKVVSIMQSPIKGGDGNIEYLFYGVKKVDN